MIQAKFKYSPSVKYDLAVALAKLADNYSCSGSGRSAEHTATYSLKNYNNATKLVDVISGWKGFNLQVNGSPYSRRDLIYVQTIYQCWSKAAKLSDPETYCRSYQGRHEPSDELERALTVCRMVRVIKFNFSWYDYGYIDLSGKWKIDKPVIAKKIINEIDAFRIDLCPLFKRDNLLSLVESLPDCIDYKVYEQLRYNGQMRPEMRYKVPDPDLPNNVIEFPKKD